MKDDPQRSPRSPPVRKLLPHDSPRWVWSGATFFITITSVPRGSDQLTRHSIPDSIRDSIRFCRDRGLWWPQLVLLMPDHLHGLFVFPPTPGMAKTVRDWKHFTARQFKIRWQRDFSDHRIRSPEALGAKWNCIVENPVRAGLVEKPEEWPHVWTEETLG